MITPIILCGGSGTRLWPLSRKSYPKQFVPLVGDKTLFQGSALRMTGSDFAAPVVITNSDFRFIVTEQLQEVGIDPGAILIEPDGRNTAPAVLAAALYIARKDPDAVLLVAPSDHIIPDTNAFKAAIEAGLSAVDSGQLVTFGITPTHPETAYGYLELTTPSDGQPVALKRFVEKPDAERAAAMLAEGSFLWNAGIFLFRARDIIAAFETHAPDLIAPVTAAIETGHVDLGFCRLGPEAWAGAKDISIDYAVMEKADNLSVVPFDGGWSDLGGWDAVWRESDMDTNGVVTSGEATAIDCTDSLLRSDSDRLEVVGIGLKNVMAIAMNDAVLVADMSRAQDVKKAVDALKAKGSTQATTFPKDHRPWGWFESLAISDRFQVKRIHVHPGAALSLQSHHHRAEHWIVVSGTAEVTIDDKVQLVTENESVYIPLGAVHRMRNPGKVPMVLIEVQTGAYLGEDDIIRYEDVYARGQGAKG
ncbi:mannose-1-phosphate guanylyltransferase/mannose-6-phosphate isomerase [Marivivens sp.]|jgi:mannose-1-phosphate guanylyltransferase / mannose-6-phosphate isomerase|uniref:mannose-1-phosphate guanylyltransferase/mannose-6-phosphate isomerase n=1 Tax=Marivivens sp. TaxID=1978374 RepID=UPI00201FA776|nr:mannose-1-phosphate guanylyltransferase/mannose-6-phosphate isomerase [Marivivens sp.]MCL7406663.1 mannose-1-phosphate guanylyltransferase/mannose-6-phosphate isomerase [Marivivens geojensis]